MWALIKDNKISQGLDSLGVLGIEQAEQYYNEAYSLYKSGKPDEAIAKLETSILLDPTYEKVYNLKGNIHIEKKEFELSQ